MLAGQNLRMTLVDTSHTEAFTDWLQAEWRGFHGPNPSSERLAHQLSDVAYRRTTGVYDDSLTDSQVPIATVSSWVAELTIAEGRTVNAWAISAVTVSPTHRRRGIARALLEAELRTATDLGIPLAMLTVSESTIYGRFGFAPAVMAADWTFDTARVNWTGPDAAGRVEFVSLERWRSEVAPLHNAWRRTNPGEIDVWPGRWDNLAGLDGDPSTAKPLRAVRHVGASGQTEGLALYKLVEDPASFTNHTLVVEYLLTTTPDAYAALWRFLLEMDLVSRVVVRLRSVDEPVRWMISDFRAVAVSTYDHLWLRLLDVPAALAARGVDDSLALEVVDPLGIAQTPLVEPVEAASTGVEPRATPLVEPVETEPRATLSINALSALYAGHVSAETLATAGLISGDATALDDALGLRRTPWLSVWF